MDLNTITVAQFKAQFFRDFPYLPNYDATALYNTGDEVYYATSKLFYTALVNGITGVTPGTDPTKWNLTTDSINNYIQDQDITNALAEAQAVFNQALFGSDTLVTLAYLYVTAHYLVNDIRASNQGLEGNAQFPMNSRAVGSVSESYSVPQRYLDDPLLAFYTNTPYGMKYLSMVLPSLIGNMAAICGGTNP